MRLVRGILAIASAVSCVAMGAATGCNGAAANPPSGGGVDAATGDDGAADGAITIPADAAGDIVEGDSSADVLDVDGHGPTVHFQGTTVHIPSGSILPGVTVCAFARPDIPCVVSDATLATFDLLLPANSETGVTLTVGGYASVLVPVVTGSGDQNGWRIGMEAASDQATWYAAFGAKYPDSTTGYLLAGAASPAGQGVAGLAMAMTPGSGEGPFYFAADQTPAPGAAATSIDSVALFANVTPGEVTVGYGPSAFACALHFGGWPSAVGNAVRVPISAGFETHVSQTCLAPTVDADAAAEGGADAPDDTTAADTFVAPDTYMAPDTYVSPDLPPPTFAPPISPNPHVGTTWTITCPIVVPGELIFYTTDQTIPTHASKVYTGPVQFTSTGVLTVTAICSAPGHNDSPSASATWTVVPP
jgi:hypothetical protein